VRRGPNFPEPEWIGNERGAEYLELTFTYFSQIENREIQRRGGSRAEAEPDCETKCCDFSVRDVVPADGGMARPFEEGFPAWDPKVESLRKGRERLIQRPMLDIVEI
jgi:hypothetical protein